MPYASCNSAISLSSMPMSASVSVTSSTGKAGSAGSAAQAPTAAPTAPDARDAPTISASAMSSVFFPWNWARSIAPFRTRSLGAMATTCAVNQPVPVPAR